MDKTDVDVLIIGGGPAGYLAAERAAESGLSVVLFEARALGGVCLNEGCIPTKTYLYSAKLYENALNGINYGVNAINITLDHNAVVNRKDNVVKTLVSGVESKMKHRKVNVIKSRAQVTGKSDGRFNVEASGASYSGRYLLIAAGSKPIIPAIPGMSEAIEGGFAMTSREILELREIPRKLCIIGAGIIGLEMAAYFATAGAKVNVIEMQNKIAGYMDAEISDMLMKELQKKGVDFWLGCKTTEIAQGIVVYEHGGKVEKLEADAVLVSVGRRPGVDNLGLEALGVYTKQGAIVTDNNLRTNISGVYAIGDVNGKSMLAHTAYREAEAAINHILQKKDHMRYDAIPSVIYTSPEVGSVGETEESAAKKGIEFYVKKKSMRHSGRFVAENEKADGLCKLLFEKTTNRLIGAHLIGSYASEIIYGASMMIESRWPVDDLKEIVFPHPSVSEIVRETLF